MVTGTATDRVTKYRPGLIGVIMLGLLGISLAIAWGISARQQSYADQGAKLVERIHRSGLGAFWHGPSQAFYLVRQTGGDTGWEAHLRVPTKDGGFEGVNVLFTESRAGVGGYFERWALNSDATEGSYDAGKITPDIRLAQDTQIKLSAGHVDVSQVVQEGRELREVSSRAAAPNNYLPEGVLPLALTLVAQDKTKAFFKLVINDLPPSEDDQTPQTRFGWANAEYRRQETIRQGGGPVQTSVVEERLRVLGQEVTRTLYVAANGTTVLETRPQETATLVGLGELLKVFPNAQAIIARVAAGVKFDLSALGSGAGGGKKPSPAKQQKLEGYD